MLIGITGQIGSGKSTVASLFKKHGAFIISADRIGKDVVEKSPALKKKLAVIFGREILTPGGRLRRRRLGDLVFSSKKSRDRLNALIHPHLLRQMDLETKQALQKFEMVVIDAALLLDWNWDRRLDVTILVNAPRAVKIKRLMDKGFTLKEARQRLNAQIPYRAVRARADLVIVNSSSLSDLESKVLRIIRKLS
nr:dephospho-CoA kinase [candidate division Zixibacteria bacterium]